MGTWRECGKLSFVKRFRYGTCRMDWLSYPSSLKAVLCTIRNWGACWKSGWEPQSWHLLHRPREQETGVIVQSHLRWLKCRLGSTRSCGHFEGGGPWKVEVIPWQCAHAARWVDSVEAEKGSYHVTTIWSCFHDPTATIKCFYLGAIRAFAWRVKFQISCLISTLPLQSSKSSRQVESAGHTLFLNQ